MAGPTSWVGFTGLVSGGLIGHRYGTRVGFCLRGFGIVVALGEVIALLALLALLSGISLSPKLLGRYSWHSKNGDSVSLLCVHTSWFLTCLPPLSSHVWIPLHCTAAPSLAGTLTASLAGTLSALFPYRAPLLLRGSRHWVYPLVLHLQSCTLLYGRKPCIRLSRIMV